MQQFSGYHSTTAPHHRVFTLTYAGTHACIYTCLHLYICTCMHVCFYMCTYMHACLDRCGRACGWAWMHTNTPGQIHSYYIVDAHTWVCRCTVGVLLVHRAPTPQVMTERHSMMRWSFQWYTRSNIVSKVGWCKWAGEVVVRLHRGSSESRQKARVGCQWR